VNNHNFKAFFKQFGEVIDSVVMIDRGTNRHRGFGFVAFQDSSVAKTVLSKGNEGKPVPEGGWKRGQLDIFGRMCEVKVSEPKKNPYAGESGGNGQNVSSKSSCSSDTSAGIIPSDIQFQAGYQNTYDSQYGAWGDFVIAPLPPNADVYPPVVPGPVPAPSQLQGYSELNMCQVNPIRYYGNPYDGGMYETYPGAVYDQCVYNPYMYPYHGPVYAPPPQYYHLPPGGASEYGYCYSYTAVPQQDPVVPAGMTLPAEGNPQAAEGNPQAADPSIAQEGKEEKVEECYSYPAVPQQNPVVPAGMTLPAEGNPQAADPSIAQEGKEEKVEECYSYPAVPQQNPVVPAGMTLPAEGNPQAADPSFAQEGKEEKVEE